MEKRNRSIDMLSGLPDEILHHILSFLPTKTSMSTSVLAKRWRFLWAHVPNLQFYKHSFRRGSETQHFDIISRVIVQHEAKIVDTFKLSNVKVCAYQLETLLIYTIKRSVRNLYLHFYSKFNRAIVCTLPRLLFTCKTLVDLTLVSCGVISSSGELFLPNLKKLDLIYVQYEDDESLPRLLSGCPVLEELIINDCFREEQNNSGCVIVSSPTIKMLNVSISQGLEHYPDEILIIDVPALVYLEVYGCYFGHAKSLRRTMTSLIEAKFTLSGPCACGIDCTQHVRSVEFLSCLCHVKCLEISSGFDETPILLVGNCSMAKFVNLTNLKLYLTVDWYDVVKFLEVADNLEVLFINVYAMLPDKEPERVPTCMLSRLKTVRMSSFYACQNAPFDRVRYVLRNALVLETMEIDPARHISNKNKLRDALRRISLFERGSKSCQVAFTTVRLDDITFKTVILDGIVTRLPWD